MHSDQRQLTERLSYRALQTQDGVLPAASLVEIEGTYGTFNEQNMLQSREKVTGQSLIHFIL
jgi:hypothetical protein